MNEECKSCQYELAYSLQFQNLKDDLSELKERVARLESTLARGVMLLIANLLGVAMMLAKQLMQS